MKWFLDLFRTKPAVSLLTPAEAFEDTIRQQIWKGCNELINLTHDINELGEEAQAILSERAECYAARDALVEIINQQRSALGMSPVFEDGTTIEEEDPQDVSKDTNEQI